MKLGYGLFFISVLLRSETAFKSRCIRLLGFFLKITIIIFVINLIKILKYFMYVSTIAVDIYRHKKIHLHSI